MVLYFFNIAPKFFAGNNLCMMFHADLGAEFFGPADFIVLFAKVESHGKGILPREEGGYITAVYAAAEETTHFHVANLVNRHAVFEYFFDAIYGFFFRQGVVGFKARFPVPGCGNFPITVPQVVGRRKQYTPSKKVWAVRHTGRTGTDSACPYSVSFQTPGTAKCS